MMLWWGVFSWNMNAVYIGLLSGMMSQLFGLSQNATLMVFITALLGAIIGGFASLTGAFLHKKP
jgi:branched-subunit amino acid ABC-type transport system permease component